MGWRKLVGSADHRFCFFAALVRDSEAGGMGIAHDDERMTKRGLTRIFIPSDEVQGLSNTDEPVQVHRALIVAVHLLFHFSVTQPSVNADNSWVKLCFWDKRCWRNGTKGPLEI